MLIEYFTLLTFVSLSSCNSDLEVLPRHEMFQMIIDERNGVVQFLKIA